MMKKKFSSLALSHLEKYVGGYPKFGRFHSIATTAFAVVTANRRSVAGASLERQAHHTWERPHVRDHWVAIVSDSTE